MPPVARIGYPGIAFAIFDTALSAMGRIASPDTPPYVVFFASPMLGHAEASGRRPMRPETVFVAVTPAAPRRLRDVDDVGHVRRELGEDGDRLALLVDRR